MPPKPKKAAAAAPASKSTPPGPPKPEPKTIGERLEAEYLASRPYAVLVESKGFAALTPAEKLAYANSLILESQTYLAWTPQQQKEFLKLCETQKIPFPKPKPQPLGTDRRGRKFEDYTFEEFERWEDERSELLHEKRKSEEFRERVRDSVTPVTIEEIREERSRRARIAEMEGSKKPGRYSGDPAWDDVVPIPQDDGERPLAAIAYTDEYSEAISYLRAVMAVDELTPRILDLTAHIIKLNPAHYTVWLYRASALFKLNSPLQVELEWLNEIALANQKNYQIWHHRQLIVEAIFPSLVTPAEQQEFAKSEVDFITIMFEEDSKNYHVWSYRQYLVRKMSLFPSQTASTPLPNELTSIETLVRNDVRNNSAWSHRFFVVFSDPNISTPGSKATEPDTAVPGAVIDREIEVAKSAIWRAPQNQSPWNYLRGVLRKGGRGVETLTCFAEEFVKFDEANDTEDVKSSHALDLLADIWTAKGERQQADKALRLLGEKYDPIRKNYWEWRRDSLAL